MTAIYRRQGREKKFYASVHGIDMKLPTDSEPAHVELTPEGKDLIARAREKKIAEIRKRNG